MLFPTRMWWRKRWSRSSVMALIKHVRSLESYRQVCLIRVGAKLCRTVALQDRSFPALHYDTNLRLYQMQSINVFQVFFPFYLMISWHFLTDLLFCIALWTLSYDMWMGLSPWFSTIVAQRKKNTTGWSKKSFINKMFPKKWNNCTIKMYAVEG